MQRLDGRLVHSTTDLNNFTECLHLIALERDVATKTLVRPTIDDPTGDLIRRKGDEHERAYYERMREQYGTALVAFEDRAVPSRAAYDAAERATYEAMAAGARMIFQATFFDGTFLGRADFLRRVERPSSRWAWSYEVIDTKLALSPKPHFLIQLCQYSEHVARLQGSAPLHASIVLGSGAERTFRVEEFAPYYRRLKRNYLASVARQEDAYPVECAHCDLCAWTKVCERRRDLDDHLSLVAGMRRDQISRLENAGITTIAALAAAPDADVPKRMNAGTFANLRAQAAEQHGYRAARAAGEAIHTYRFRPLEAKAGFTQLPEPQLGDVFFDMEGDPMYRPGASLEYLFGCYLPDDPEGERYRAFWGTTPADERTAFDGFVDFIRDRQARYPNLHVYHYAPYETTALKRLSGRFGSREFEVDTFLRRHTFVDLFPIVRQSMWISQDSYSIKKVEALYGFKRETKTRGGDDSIVMFEHWLETQDPAELEDIRAYNEDDCVSTFKLREWLVARRSEFNATVSAAEPVPWLGDPEPVESKEDPKDAERLALASEMLRDLPAPEDEAELRHWPEDLRARWLLANLMQYHRREGKSGWWEFFDRRSRPTEMIDDRQALGGLVHLPALTTFAIGGKERDINVYSFPEQEFDVSKGPCDVDTGKSVGKIVGIDEDAQTIRIQTAKNGDPATLRAIIPNGPMPTRAHAAQLQSIARAYRAGTLAADYPATAGLLLRRKPFIQGLVSGRVQPDSLDLESISRTVRGLRESALVVQGPPGTGKTTSGAHAIVDLLLNRKRVALAALSHAALHNLCHKIEEVAAARGLTFAGCHKGGKSDENVFASRRDDSTIVDATNDDVLLSCDLVSSPVYSWASSIDGCPALARHFDVLVIDEAGQVSLADALVVSRLAHAVVLLGDPQQLPQVSNGTHPVGTGASILEHLLGDEPTVAPDTGVFLERSFRLQPRIAAFVSDSFYDGRLRAASKNEKNRVDSSDLSGGGLRFAPSHHDNNKRNSPEEAQLVAKAVAALLGGGTTTLRGESSRTLKEADILVVSPYNAQRVAIRNLLARRGFPQVRVGTVDKFQGQEAPVVFYSMATSSAELAPRGLDFLLSPNRFNVAVSRAEALALVTCSPLLLSSRATSIEGMRLLSMLCGYVEAAIPTADEHVARMMLPF